MKLQKKTSQCLWKNRNVVVVNADTDAELIIGFDKDSSPEEFIEAVQNDCIEDLLHKQVVHNDEVFFLPAGRIHAIGKGLLIAEIQQTSDITYRIYDFNRTDEQGNTRELHVDLAVDVIDYKAYTDYKTHIHLHRGLLLIGFRVSILQQIFCIFRNLFVKTIMNLIRL
jgi:mannose-6-phosphate isomerase